MQSRKLRTWGTNWSRTCSYPSFFIASVRLRRGRRPLRLGEARNLIFGRDLRIWKDFKTAAFEPQCPLRPQKFQTPAATRRADLAVRPVQDEAGIFKDRLHDIRRLAETFQRITPAE